MKLRNMQTLEDKEINLDNFYVNELYENYKCVDDFYVIYPDGFIHFNQYAQPIQNILHLKSIGNYFETKEEAEKAVEKLKAWKRLKDKGFRFVEYDTEHCGLSTIYFVYDNEIDKKDLDLLFGGEK